MASKLSKTKSMKVTATGIFDYNDGVPMIEIEDYGPVSMVELMKEFDGVEITFNASYKMEEV